MATRKTPAKKARKTTAVKPAKPAPSRAAPAAAGRAPVIVPAVPKGGDQAKDRALVAEAVHPGRRAAHALAALAERLRVARPAPVGARRAGASAGADVVPALEALAEAYRRLLDPALR